MLINGDDVTFGNENVRIWTDVSKSELTALKAYICTRIMRVTDGFPCKLTETGFHP